MRRSQPVFSFRGVDVIDHKKNEPGPGQYEPLKCMEAVRQSAPAITMGQRPDVVPNGDAS
jgi:hypothetical protein